MAKIGDFLVAMDKRTHPRNDDGPTVESPSRRFVEHRGQCHWRTLASPSSLAGVFRRRHGRCTLPGPNEPGLLPRWQKGELYANKLKTHLLGLGNAYQCHPLRTSSFSSSPGFEKPWPDPRTRGANGDHRLAEDVVDGDQDIDELASDLELRVWTEIDTDEFDRQRLRALVGILLIVPERSAARTWPSTSPSGPSRTPVPRCHPSAGALCSGCPR